jgi:putative tricarboxylic transport membrane protein
MRHSYGSKSFFFGLTVGLAGMVAALPTLAQWKPDRTVEIVAPSGPGGTTDRTARVVAKILTQHKLVDVPVNVVNKPGGSGTIGLNYLNQHPGDGHYIVIATTGSISNHILGLIPYNHTSFTPLAMLFEEYLGVNVRTGRPFRGW